MVVTEETTYPFGEAVKLKVNPERAVRFPLLLRIPAWANPVSIAVNGFKQRGIEAGTLLQDRARMEAGRYGRGHRSP